MYLIKDKHAKVDRCFIFHKAIGNTLKMQSKNSKFILELDDTFYSKANMC